MRRSKKNSIGIALAGGGPSGIVYEIGALRALEEAIEGLDLADASSYVGVSAGSFVAAALANGITPSRMMQMLFREVPGEQPFVPGHFFKPAYREWLRRGMRLPRLLAAAAWGCATKSRDETVFEHLIPISRAFPVGIFDNEPIREYVQRLLAAPGRTDDFRVLARRGRQLTIVSSELETAGIAPFGRPGWDEVPISTAVQASTAVPGLYRPVEIDGRHFVDGALLKTVHSSIACEDGARFVLVLNPMVPITTATRGAILDHGFPAAMHQSVRTAIHSRLKVSLAGLRERFPRTDIVLFEPGHDDHELFFGESFSFSSRQLVCESAYRITRRQLLARRSELAPILRRHGMRLRLDVLRDETREPWTSVGLRPSRRTASVTQSLEAALDRLERAQLPAAG